MSVEITKKVREYGDGADAIVITQVLADIPGGVSLDVTGYKGDVIRSGHVVVKDAKGVYKPLAVTGDTYGAVAEGETPVGLVISSVSGGDARVGVMTMGQVNGKALKPAVPDAVKKLMPHIQFIY